MAGQPDDLSISGVLDLIPSASPDETEQVSQERGSTTDNPSANNDMLDKPTSLQGPPAVIVVLPGPQDVIVMGEGIASTPDGTYGQFATSGGTSSHSCCKVNADRKYSGPDLNFLLRDTHRYSREELMKLRFLHLYTDIWPRKYKPHVTENFSELIRSEPDGDDCSGDDSKTISLRPYQEEVIAKSLQKENDIIILPTGTGKTIVAIQIILEHLETRRHERSKVIFFAPTKDLVTQQKTVIKKYMGPEYRSKCCQVIGDDNMAADELKRRIKDDDYCILVVTPDIIKNYFLLSREASLSDFTLLIFDETHHAAKKHSYNRILNMYRKAKLERDSSGELSSLCVPQMLGMTATIGIGKSTSQLEAKEYILRMCAKFGMESAPSQSDTIMSLINHPIEEYKLVERRSSRFSSFIRGILMEPLEEGIFERLEDDERFKDASLDPFPEDRLLQTYEQYVVNLLTKLDELPPDDTDKDIQYCKVALRYLREYYKVLLYTELLHSEHGMGYINEFKDRLDLCGIDNLAQLLNCNISHLEELRKLDDKKNPNGKIVMLKERLEKLFEKTPDSKIIIFVQIRKVAVFMANLLNSLNRGVFKAKEFISTGSNENDAGMRAQERIDVRKYFEGDKYNILVATSVAEEGLDIQACNMVVRYMYIKDMIAKIQSRVTQPSNRQFGLWALQTFSVVGRARHPEGVLLTFLDNKLRDQEEKNNYKETLMYKALAEIKGMTAEEFSRQMNDLSTQDSDSDSEDEDEATRSSRGVKVHCRLCTTFLCDLSSIRRYMDTYHLVLDPRLHEKVKLTRRIRNIRMFDGIEDCLRMVCSHQNSDDMICGHELGKVIRMNNKFYYAVLSATMITLCHNGGDSITLEKYKDIASIGIKLDHVFIEDLETLADGAFPSSVINETLQAWRF